MSQNSFQKYFKILEKLIFSLRREYIPLSLIELQRIIDLGWLDTTRLIDVCALCATRLFDEKFVPSELRQFGIDLTDEVFF